MALEIIGAGFGRTGTMSLKLALERLGFDPCYHMHEVMRHPEHDALWQAATRDDEVDWDLLFKDYTAGVDWPIAAFWRQLAVHYPSARFILTVRDTQAWYRSISRTIFQVLTGESGAQTAHRAMTRELILERTFSGRHDDGAHVMATYEAHNRAVREALPAERLLVYETGAGWAPLCDFLGLEVPQEPFPQTNSTQDFQTRVLARQSEARNDA